MNEETRILLQKAQSGDQAALERVMTENFGLVRSIVRRFPHHHADWDDLFQIGCIGLLKAVRRFDLSYDVMFSTYAVPMILGEIKRFLRDDGMIKVSRKLKETAYKIRTAEAEWEAEHGTAPALSELAQKTGISPEEISLALDAVNPPDSLDRTASGTDGKPIPMLDRLKDPVSAEQRILTKIALEQGLAHCSPRDRKLIQLRYFEGKTQLEIASVLGISQVQVSRLEKRILTELRSYESLH